MVARLTLAIGAERCSVFLWRDSGEDHCVLSFSHVSLDTILDFFFSCLYCSRHLYLTSHLPFCLRCDEDTDSLHEDKDDCSGLRYVSTLVLIWEEKKKRDRLDLASQFFFFNPNISLRFSSQL